MSQTPVSLPQATFGELGKKIGELYRNLTPDEKAKYEKLAAKDKLRYQTEMEAWKKSKSGAKPDAEDDGVDDDIDSDDDDSDEE